MGSKGRMPRPNFRRPVPGPGMLHPDAFGPDIHPPPVPFYFDMLPPPEVMEQKLNVQHVEMQRLATENERLAASLSTLRQDLAAAQQEYKRLKTHAETAAMGQDEQLRALLDRIARMEADLKASEPIKMELQQAHTEAQGLVAAREELIAKIQQLNQDLQRSHSDAKQIPALMSELEAVRQEYQHCRVTYDYERKLRIDHFESLQGMENNYMSMAREVEKLRSELKNATNIDKSASGVLDGNFGANTSQKDRETLNNSFIGQNSHGDSYGVAQGHVPSGGTPQYSGTTPVHAPGRYDTSRPASYDASKAGSYNPSGSGTYEASKGAGYEIPKASGYEVPRGSGGAVPPAGVGQSGGTYGSNKASSPYGTANGTAQPTYGSAQQLPHGSTQQPAFGSMQQAGYTSPQQPTYRSQQQSAYGSTQQSAYGSTQQSAYGLAQQPTYGLTQQPSYSSAQQPSYNAAQQPSYRAGQQSVYGSAQQSAYRVGQQPAYVSGQTPTQAGAGYEASHSGNYSRR